MIGLGQHLAFLGVSLLVICTPGQDTALTIRNTLLGGRGTGSATALGVSAGQATWTVATSARSVLKSIGSRNLADDLATRPAMRLSPRSAFVQGFLSNLSNAKMVAFFISLLPPFAGPHPSFGVLIALGLNFSILTLAWLVGYAFAVGRMGRWLRRSSIRRALDGILGAVLVGLGIRVGAEAIAR